MKRRNLEAPPPVELSTITDECWVGQDLLVAPILKEWFFYGKGNSTAVDIRWLIMQLTTSLSDRGRFFYVKQDHYLVWSRLPSLCDGDVIPAKLEPRDEWVVYTSWVEFVLSRSATAQKYGRVRELYPDWLKRNFPEYEDPIWH